ncbi:MAG: choice-of-anchor V domain-containing protein [Flavobacteriia bacterium]|jgi:hypothetical protein
MKKNYILSLSGILLIGALSLQKSGDLKIEKFFAKNGHKFFSGGAAAGLTGAPTEGNCTSCHSGSVQSGSAENVLTVLSGATPVTSYTPGQTYTVTLVMSSNPAKKGFQATAWDLSNTMAGTFTAGTNTAINGTIKNYANHKSTSNTNAVTAWIWSWTAPATNVGDVKFYVATNKANGNSDDTGDMIYTSQHIISAPTSAGVNENSVVASNFRVGYNGESNALNFSFHSLIAGEMSVNIVDLNGRSVFFGNLGNAVFGENIESLKLPSDFKNGIYIANFFVNNNAMSAKFMVQR